ncbi:MAG TPA: tRNA uridine-5-carboxymethylaminomethyl(34) synthesis GTPase MnmE [Gemmatimonadaceae bacterium]|nr:tRNA uridine-5-carboxymethylaminomethyl(34) synthesis GTPase MnmE [Gemmatimonadaceae bacterium]
MRAEDTIAAIATARGRGALSIVRLSGPAARQIAATIVSPWPPQVRRATLATIRDRAGGSVLDEGIVVLFAGPESFTGEDAVELTLHGGPAVARAVLSALVGAGARLAEPGEFTRRALLNGRVDLLQAEAIGDLAEARTDAMRALAIRQLDGGLTRRLSQLRERVLEVEALLAYEIDFPEEDDGPLDTDRLLRACRELDDSIGALLATRPAAMLARDGATVVLAGAPNAGKSALFNALLGTTRALVTEVPGTTRDAIEELLEFDGWPIRLIDTAGLRDSADTVEQLGIEMSTRYLARADLVLGCAERPEEFDALAAAMTGWTTAPMIRVVTKSDMHADQAVVPDDAILTSAMTGEGLTALLERMVAALELAHGRTDGDDPVLTRARHVEGLERARLELRAFVAAWRGDAIPAAIAAVHLRAVIHELDELIGAVTVEDVLARVFSTFCVGK